MNKVIGSKVAFWSEENGCTVSQSVIEDVNARLAELQQERLNLVRKTGAHNKEHATQAAEIEILRNKRQGLKDAVAERAWKDKRIEEITVYLAAQDSLLDKFDEDLFRRLIEKVKVQSMVEVVFLFKTGVENMN